jgi:ubiquinone/menaquinone biosynthesis C-methylase UbiE
VRADAETYTHGHAPSVLRSHSNRTVANSAAYLAPLLVPGATVLDVGCGPGTISVDIAARVAPGRVLAIDATEAPLAGARERAAAAGIETVTFAVGDAYALDAPDGGSGSGFDVVHAHQVLQHLGDPVAALQEMLRVCRTGGVVAARDADYAAMTWYPSDPRLDRWLALYRAVALGNGAQPDAGRRLLAWAHAAGAGTVTPSASVWCYATPQERAWWGGMWADRIVGSDLTRQALDGGFTDEDELRAIAAAWREWAEHPDGWFTVLHGEVLATPART